MAPIQFYYYPLSMPSRSVRLFIKKTGIPVHEHIIDLSKEQQHSAEYKKINPRHCVPCIIDRDNDDFIVTEGWAIVLYLIARFPEKVPKHWYPEDLKLRTRVNEYLSYHDGSTRGIISKVFQDEFLFAMRPELGKRTTKEDAEQHLNDMKYVATQLQDTFLKDKKFLCGDQISVADLFCVAEVLQPIISGRDTTKDHPNLAKWVDRVKKELNPEFDEVYKHFYEVREKFMANPKATNAIEREVIQPTE